MLTSPLRLLPRLPSSYLDYARHMPKAYVERTKRTVPKKVFTQRFGAPDIVQWKVHPDDYEETGMRPWEYKQLQKNQEREKKYTQAMLSRKFYELKRPISKRIADEKWTIFVGDRVEVMVGKDKGKQGTVLKVCRESSQVWVEGMNGLLEDEWKDMEQYDVGNTFTWKEQPLSVLSNEVKLVDPNDQSTCDAEWILSSDGSEYLRTSTRSGFEIPIPSSAFVTYEYLQPEKYIETEGKDTPSSLVLERTYVPKLATFSEEISEQHGIASETGPPSYWY